MAPLPQSIKDALNAWKQTPIRAGDIPYAAAVRSVGTSAPLVEARKDGSDRWTVRPSPPCIVFRPDLSLQLYDVKTGVVAVLSFAAIFAVADDYQTGNFVPKGQVGPPGVRPCALSFGMRSLSFLKEQSQGANCQLQVRLQLYLRHLFRSRLIYPPEGNPH